MPLRNAVGTYLVYKFIRGLTTSWEDMPAYDLGIIDDSGKLLKKSKDLSSKEEREAYTLFDRLVWNIKRAMEKLPGGSSKLASYAAAGWLLKEEKEALFNNLKEEFDVIEIREAKTLFEEVAGPVNVAASVPRADKPLKKKKKKDDEEKNYVKRNDIKVESMSDIKSLRLKIDEAKQIKKVIRGGKQVKKVTCPSGQKNVNGRCVPETSQDKQRFKKAAKKRKRTLAGKSQSAAQRKRAKSNRKRNSMGL